MRSLTVRSLAAALLALFTASPASAQFWESAGAPSSQPNARICFNDSVRDWLVVGGGNIMYIDSLHSYYPLFRYDGHSWDTLGLFGNVVNSAVLWHDTLIVGGGFEWMQQDTIRRIACYVDGAWHPYGNLYNYSESVGGPVFRLRIIDGELYVLGVFKYADGQLCNGVAKRVGGHWEPLPNWPNNFQGDPYLWDIARFQGRLVAAGNFNSPDMYLRDMLQYDGNAWVPVCSTCFLGWMDGVAVLSVYKENLYVGGRFQYSGGNPAQGIMRWDGEAMHALAPAGSGVQLDNFGDAFSPSIFTFLQRDGRLFMNGALGFVNHMPTPGVASWDGTNFCALGGADPLTGGVSFAFGFYHDSLYSAHADGLPPYDLVRYLSTDFAYQCSTMGVAEAGTADDGLQVAWLAEGAIRLSGLPDGPHHLQVFDAQGRLVLQRQVRSTARRTDPIPFSGQGTALYVAVVDGQRAGRLMPLW